MSESAKLSAAGERYLPQDRESFLDAQRRNRHATWRLSAICVMAAVVMGIPLALTITPLLYAVALMVAEIINYASPLPPEFWQTASQFGHIGLQAFDALLQQKPTDPQTLAIGAAVMLLPGVLLSIALWMAVNILFRRAGVGGALLALKAREPNQTDLKELQLADVAQEMAIAAGLPSPRVMLVDGPGANAAAIGTSPDDARIVISRRLIDDLNRDQLEGVLAHLIGSIGNGDLRIAFRITSIFETCGLLVALINSPFGPRSRRVLWRIIRYGIAGSSNNPQEADAVADLLTRSVSLDTDDIDDFFDPTSKKSGLRSIRNFVFFPIFFTNMAIRLSLWFFSTAVLGPSVALLWHTRQYLADASAVQLTRNPDGLGTALQKLNQEPGEIPGGDWASHLFVVSPKPGDHKNSGGPDGQQKQVLAKAWTSSAQPVITAPTASIPLDFAAVQQQFAGTFRAAMAGDAQAIARLRTVYQEVTAADPALAAQIPNPDDFFGARQGDRAAMARLRAARRHPGSQVQARAQTGSKDGEKDSGMSSISMIGFHPSLKRRLKRLDRMGAHVQLEAAEPKERMILLVFSLFLAPFAVAIVGLLLLLIAIMTAASLTFMMIWLALIHSVFGLLAHH